MSEAVGEIEAAFVDSRITPAPEMVAPSSTSRLGSLSPAVLVRAKAVLASELTRTKAPWPAMEIFEEAMVGNPVELKEEPPWSVSEVLEARIRSAPESESVSVMESEFTSTTVPVVVPRRSPPMSRLEAPQELKRAASKTTPSATVEELPMVIALWELMSILAPKPSKLRARTLPWRAKALLP